MPKTSELISPWFQHDFLPRADKKILKMLLEFRKSAKKLSKEELEELVPLASYGIFWSIVEYMHQNSFSQEDIEILAEDLRISPKYIKNILDDYQLFHLEDGYYISDRVIRNIEEQEAKQKTRIRAANKRWVVGAFRTWYKEIFEQDPVLKDDEMNSLADYALEIKNLKELLPDIIYTLKKLKFKNNPNFNPGVNWLLKEGHLAQLVNGEFGGLLHYTTKEEKEAQENIQQEERKKQQEFQKMLDKISTKEEALLCIKNHYRDTKICITRGRAMILPNFRKLMNKFDITEKEVLEVCPH